MEEFDGSEIWEDEKRKKELNKPGAMLFGRVERKQRVKLDDYTGYEDLYTQFQSRENKKLSGQGTVEQRVDDYQGKGPGRIVMMDRTNAGDGIFFYPDDPDFDKKAVESVAGWGRAFNAPAEFAPLLSVAAKLPTLARQRSLNRAKMTFMRVDEDLNISNAFNVTPYADSALVKQSFQGFNRPSQVSGFQPRGTLPKRTSSEIVRQHGQKAGFHGPEGEPLVRLNFTPASVFQMDANASLLKDAVKERIPRPDLDYFQSFRKEPNTATLTEDQYKQAWANYPDHSKKGWENFQAEQGKFIVGGYKMKPPGTIKGTGKRITKEQVLEGIKQLPKDWSPNLTTSMDEGIHSRNMRAQIATYWFGGTPATTKKASYKVDGKNIEPHHRTSHGEISPWTDVIIKKLQAPKGSKEYQEGLEMLEIGKDVFRSSPFYAGDVYENYEGYTKIDHTGKKGTNRGIHNKLGIKKDDEGNFIGYRVHGPGGKSALDFPEYTGSKGIDGVPTKEYIQNLPFKREDVFKYRENIIKGGRLTGKYIKGGKLTMEGNTFFNTLYEWLRYSDVVKDAARKEILAESNEPVGKNWAKGER